MRRADKMAVACLASCGTGATDGAAGALGTATSRSEGARTTASVSTTTSLGGRTATPAPTATTIGAAPPVPSSVMPARSPEGQPASAPPPAIQLTVALTRNAVPRGEALEGKLTMYNNSEHAVDVSRSSSCATQLGLYQQDVLVGRAARGCRGAIEAATIEPNETREFSFDHVFKQPGTTELPPAGTYDLWVGYPTVQSDVVVLWWAPHTQRVELTA